MQPHNHIFYSNRANAHYQLGDFEESLKDADKCIELNPEWGKVRILSQMPSGFTNTSRTADNLSSPMILFGKLALSHSLTLALSIYNII